MGFAIILQAMFSICYHVCPTNLSLQFDTTMMYVICVLCYIKIYQVIAKKCFKLFSCFQSWFYLFLVPSSRCHPECILGRIYDRYFGAARGIDPPLAFLVMKRDEVAIEDHFFTFFFFSRIVFGLFILFYVVVTVFIAFDCYYIGIGRLDWAIAKELAMEILCSSGSLREWFSFKYPYRFIFYLVSKDWKVPNRIKSHSKLLIIFRSFAY